MKLGMQDRRAHIETEARRLARSGNYYSFLSIRSVLLSRGFKDAHKCSRIAGRAAS